MGKIIDATIRCWVATRVNGASASMACDSPDISLELLEAFDEVATHKMPGGSEEAIMRKKLIVCRRNLLQVEMNTEGVPSG